MRTRQQPRGRGKGGREAAGDLERRSRVQHVLQDVARASSIFVDRIGDARTIGAIEGALGEYAERLGFSHYALVQHDAGWGGPARLRLHNYPNAWVDYFDLQRVGDDDPVHRASQRATSGFRWMDLPKMIKLSSRDHDVLARAAQHGLSDGFTVPTNVPGGVPGSCSFVIATGGALPTHALAMAQLAASYAFEAVRRFDPGGATMRPCTTLSQRQRDCVLWIARGKTDWEVGRILGLSEETVVRHLKRARERYGVHKRTSLIIRALFEGAVSFADIRPE